MSETPASTPATSIDPLYRHARRELAELFVIFGGLFVWTIVTVAFGIYQQPADAPVTLTFGFPSWVFWSVVLPWLACTAVTILYALFRMRPDDVAD